MILVPLSTNAQEEIVAPVPTVEAEEHNEVFVIVEEMPRFPGGEDPLFSYLAEHIKYPDAAVEAGIQGVVYIQFVVEKDGSISEPRVLRGIGGGCDQEAIRVIASMPSWQPGKQRGVPVRVQYNLPIRFVMARTEPPPVSK